LTVSSAYFGEGGVEGGVRETTIIVGPVSLHRQRLNRDQETGIRSYLPLRQDRFGLKNERSAQAKAFAFRSRQDRLLRAFSTLATATDAFEFRRLDDIRPILRIQALGAIVNDPGLGLHMTPTMVL
jgi:hypothetical protein